MSESIPPSPLWRDDITGLKVYVNGGVVELNMGDGWSGRLLPKEASAAAAGLVEAVATANSWAKRWDASTRGYREPVAS